jgi:hypothetical protein
MLANLAVIPRRRDRRRRRHAVARARRPGVGSVESGWERIGVMAEQPKDKLGRLGKWREKRRERRARRRSVDAKKVAQAGRANVDDAMKRGGMGH